jgi:hypothetical protein
VKQQIMGLPGDLVFRTKGQLAIDILTEVFADGVQLDYVTDALEWLVEGRLWP